jgi:hypothetical protein
MLVHTFGEKTLQLPLTKFPQLTQEKKTTTFGAQKASAAADLTANSVFSSGQ